MNIFPNNKVNHYVTTLSNRIELDEDWEVALSEILFQHTWYNIQEDECMLSIITPGTEIDKFLSEGFYSDGYQLVDLFIRMIEHNLKDDGTIVDAKCIRRYFEKNQHACRGDNVVILSSDLASIMAFSPKEMAFRE